MKDKYFGSVRFFKHLIYFGMISVVSVGIFFMYSLSANAINGIKGAKDASSAASGMDIDELAPEVKVMGNALLPVIGDDENEAPEPADTLQPTGTPDVDTGEEGETVAEETAEEAPPEYSPEPIGYQLLYPDLYVEPPEEYIEEEGKVAYLTFDDGPSARTADVLDVLDEYDIKATFFVITNKLDVDMLKRVAEKGHTIGIHTHTHQYKEIYESIEAYLDDFNTAFQTIYEATSVKPEIFRFPGGSINAYNRGFYQELNSEMLRRGFVYYDWNASAGDSAPDTGSDRVYQNIVQKAGGQEKLIILMHDSQQKYASVRALPRVIEYLQSQGYSFAPLDHRVEPIVFSYK